MSKAYKLSSFLIFFLLFPILAKAEVILADLSTHKIEIDTNFTGTEVVLFGATDGVGDVVVAVRGPMSQATVRKKEKRAGIWMNVDHVTYKNVPKFYWVACSNRDKGCAPKAVKSRHQIGANNLRFKPVSLEPLEPQKDITYRKALLRNKKREGVYPEDIGKISFLGEKLFRTKLNFPANIPTGIYTVEVFQIRDDLLVGAQTIPLIARKVGFEAAIYNFAHNNSIAYGAVAVIIALIAGWMASVLFKKG